MAVKQKGTCWLQLALERGFTAGMWSSSLASMPEQVVSGSSSVRGKAGPTAPNSHNYIFNLIFEGLFDNTTGGFAI